MKDGQQDSRRARNADLHFGHDVEQQQQTPPEIVPDLNTPAEP